MTGHESPIRVFISSTSGELEPHQVVAHKVVQSLGMQPLTRDPAATKREAVQACVQQVAAADLMLAIIGWRRGRTPPPELGGDGVHPWTYWEVRSAFDLSKPVVVMMAGPSWVSETREEDPPVDVVMRDFRGELDRVAIRFEREPRDDARALDTFQELLRRELIAARNAATGTETAPATSKVQASKFQASKFQASKFQASKFQASKVQASEFLLTETLSSSSSATLTLKDFLANGGLDSGEVTPRVWPTPELPDRPYPLLLPYSHPDLLAGRDREIDQLRQLLRRPITILGLHAPSGAGKTSFLAAGLVPRLRAAGRPVALDHHPHEPGLVRRLVGDLLTTEQWTNLDLMEIEDEDHQTFANLLPKILRLADSQTPILVLDQFEELFRRGEDHRGERHMRAILGALLAASAQRQPGFDEPACRWILSYRQEFHGRVFAWLSDVHREACGENLAGISTLPHDLSGAGRFQDWPLSLFGSSFLLETPLPSVETPSPSVETPSPSVETLETACRIFQAAIEKPLAIRSADGEPHYPWRFAVGGVERLARAFGETRVARPDASLVPELQVVLGYLLERAGLEEGVIEVPDNPAELIDRALEEHLRRVLDSAFPGGGEARQGRTRALLALRELADIEGRRHAGFPVAELARAIGAGGREVLELLATAQTRLVVRVEQADDFSYRLSHDRMAEVIVRAVEEEGRSFGMAFDAELLALRRFVALRGELYRSGAVRQATEVPAGHFRLIEGNTESLLWDGQRRRWWDACQQRRRVSSLRARIRRGLAAIAVVLVSLGAWAWVDRRARLRTLFEHLSTGEPEAAFAALDHLASDSKVTTEELAEAWRRREHPFDVFERGLGGVEPGRRGEALLAVATRAETLLADAPTDPVRIAKLIWALDFFAPASARAQQLRDRALQPLRRLRPPPKVLEQTAPKWADIPAGTVWIGAGENRHQVTISAFQMAIHEVTNAEYRRLVPETEGADDLPVIRLTWYEAYTYAAWLGARLPTEEEWWYAARAGCEFAFCRRDGSEATLSEVAWWRGTAMDPVTKTTTPLPVMQLEPNPWGLYDVLGNVWEMTANWYRVYSDQSQVDPPGPTDNANSYRMIRGGCAGDLASWFTSLEHLAAPPDTRGGQKGLRVARPQHLKVEASAEPAEQ